MAGSLSVCNVDDELIARLERRAAPYGQSAEAEVRDILRHVLEDEAEAEFSAMAAELRRLTAGREHTPAEVLQREGRNER